MDEAASCVYVYIYPAAHIPIHDVCYMDIPLHSLLPLLHIYGFCIMNNQFYLWHNPILSQKSSLEPPFSLSKPPK